MKATIVVASILLFTAGLALAGEPEPAASAAGLETAANLDQGTCTDAQPLPEGEADLSAWAEEHGFLEVFTPEPETATVMCPQVISCNATHCIETTFCATTDTGNASCCTGGGACLLCLPGTTIHVTRCRCAGGGCVNPNSQTFTCA